MDERVQILKNWMAQEERGTVWVAKKIGRTKAYISHILHERLPMTDKLARDLCTTLGIPLPEKGRMTQTGTSKPTQARAKKSRKSTDS
jgi:antitoxin component HigA of HigAB toxin-antitoxin module